MTTVVPGSPEVEENDWVPLANPFAQNLAKREEQDFTFSVARGSSDSQLLLTFTGCLLGDEGSEDGGGGEGGEGGDACELSEEVSFDKLQALHRQMVELCPGEVPEDMLPLLPTVPRGIWSYLLSIDVRPTLYDEISDYLTSLAAACSVENVLSVFFAESFLSPSRYEDQWSELNRKRHQEEKEVCLGEWLELLEKKTRTEFKTMTELHSYYEEEDIAEYHLEQAEQKLHRFQTQPFEDLCEIVRKRRDKASEVAKDPERNATEQLEALKRERSFHEQYLETIESLHELNIERCHCTAQRTETILSKASEDKQALGQKLWDRRAQQRLDKIENKLNRTIVEMLKLQCRRLADQKDRALLDMAIVEEGAEMAGKVKAKEDVVYQVQFRLLEIKLRLLEEEERKLNLQERYAEGAQLGAIQKRLEHIPSKMSKLRLKMQTCKHQLDEPAKRTLNVEESYAAHFAVQKKQVAAEKEEKQQKQLMRERRQKTIQRVKTYMERNPTPVTKLPPRYLPPSQKQASKRPASKKPPPSSSSSSSSSLHSNRVSSTAALTKSVYSSHRKKDGAMAATKKPRDAGKGAVAATASKRGAEKNGKKSTAVSKKEEAVKAPTPPPFPPELEAVQPPPPPPLPPSQTTPPPPPPALPTLQLPAKPVAKTSPTTKTTNTKTTTTTKSSSSGQRTKAANPGINLSAIISARQKLKPSQFGQALGTGGLTNTTEEMACLIRTGARTESSSLTTDAASFLRQRFQHIKDVTGLSDPESDDDDGDGGGGEGGDDWD